MKSAKAKRPAPGLTHGRFAPSPTGPLHFGSLVAAVGSYLEARSQGGRWSLRIEDLDRSRCRTEHALEMLRLLEALGFTWDGEVVWQSRRGVAYKDALESLQAMGQVFACACTRRELADSLLAADGAAVYPGSCRVGLPAGKLARAHRLRVPDQRLMFSDAIQGDYSQDLVTEVGDFVLMRADGFFAYQLAVVVDDAEQGISEVVRGADLLASTPRQILLQRLLGYPQPRYAHLPVAVDGQGEKLSKQTLACPVEASRPLPLLLAVLDFLGQAPSVELCDASLDELWRWAIANWRLARVPRCLSLPAPG